MYNAEPAAIPQSLSGHRRLAMTSTGELPAGTPLEAFYDEHHQRLFRLKGGADGFSRTSATTRGGTFTLRRPLHGGAQPRQDEAARHMAEGPAHRVKFGLQSDASDTLRVMSSRFPKHNPKKPKGKDDSSAHKDDREGRREVST